MSSLGDWQWQFNYIELTSLVVCDKMSTTSLDKELQERLREASAIGDIDEVRSLVESGVNVNSQNEINGW